MSTSGGVIVLGTERSGTSAVTEMVHRWGAFAGAPEKLTPASEHNPRGQWEYEPLWDLLAQIGGFSSGVTWWDKTFADRVRRARGVERLVSKAKELVEEMAGGGGPWVWKDPALCHFLEFWAEIWGDPVYLITVRHPYDVARSWQRRAVPARLAGTVDLTECNLLRWQHMMLSVLRATERSTRKLFVEYESIVVEPLIEAGRLARFLDAQFQSRSPVQVVESMAEAVDATLHRNRCAVPLGDVAAATASQCGLYDLLRAKVRDPDVPFVDQFPMPDGWWGFVHEAEAVIRGR